MSDNPTSISNKRIAKNTVYLYFRTILIMIITLYTSRVILNVLGVEDYGVYNAVGGVVSMFAVLSGALSAAISRYITFELGKNNIERLKVIFSTSLNIQFLISGIIIILGETVGLWFVNTYLNIPPERMIAANWVWQCALLAFVINLISVPYNASIIAHEHMNAYAVISILDAGLKLGIVFLLKVSLLDKLATYAVLTVLVAAIIRLTYGIYCKRHFQECSYVRVKDKALTKEMTSFAGFSFLNNTANILNSQGLNVLINIFFGVTFNAARGIATQVEGAIMQLVNNFTVAVNPQITKSYAVGDKQRTFSLVCVGSKYAYFLMLFFAIPVFLETDFILKVWLKVVPDYAAVFLRLSLIGAMVKMLGNTGYTACMATGDIKNYSIWITSVGILAFPLTWIAFRMGFKAEYAYYVFIAVYVCVEIVRLILMKRMLDFPPSLFLRRVVLRIAVVTVICIILPFFVHMHLETGWSRLLVVILASVISVSVFVALFGMTKGERNSAVAFIRAKLKL